MSEKKKKKKLIIKKREFSKQEKFNKRGSHGGPNVNTNN